MAGKALGEHTWTEIAESAGDTVIAIPVGSTEQHGPHLPLGTDTDIASELCRRLASRRADVMVAPAVCYTSSGEHAGFPGTLSIGNDALESLLVELGRSADAFAGILFVSAHGGNRFALQRAVRILVDESRPAKAWYVPSPPGGDAHAGHVETSVMMAISPWAARPTPPAQDGCTADLGELIGVLRRSGVRAVSPNGVLGDPSGASPEEGERLLEFWSGNLEDSLRRWPPPRSANLGGLDEKSESKQGPGL